MNSTLTWMVSLFAGASPLTHMGLTYARHRVETSRAKKYLLALAQRQGFVSMPAKFGDIAYLGIVHAKELELVQVAPSESTKRKPWSELRMAAVAAEFEFDLRCAGASVRAQDNSLKGFVKTGDAEFDGVWKLQTEQAEAACAMLTPEMRAKLLALAAVKQAGYFQLRAAGLQYREQGRFDDTDRVKRFEIAIPLVAELAYAAEVASALVSPPA
jgi:hypothetical protein